MEDEAEKTGFCVMDGLRASGAPTAQLPARRVAYNVPQVLPAAQRKSAAGANNTLTARGR
jgi:hypothetical protein